MVQRALLRDQVHAAIRGWILDGEVSADDHLAEPVLAERLGVSRTPVRESLLRLEREGLVCQVGGRGFRVAPLGIKLIGEVYPIIGALERRALLDSNSRPDLARLRKLNAQLRDASDAPDRQCTLDEAWHETLLEGCSNRRLLDLISRETDMIRRYDGGIRRGVADLARSCAQHDEIGTALENDEDARAANLLELHWISCVEPVSAWLQADYQSADPPA